MRIGPDGKLHFNLYFIYAEDKENSNLPPPKIASVWAKIFKKIKNLKI